MKKLLFIFLILNIAGCSLFFNVSKREISLAEKQWKAAGIQNYNYTLIIATLSRNDECSTPKVGIEIEVRDGKLTKFGTCELNIKNAQRFGTIDRVFSTLRNEKSESPPGLEVRFNETYAFPEYIDVNYSRWYTDHRVQYHIFDFAEIK
jgi:Family of unknown function (DUF6174)